MTKKYYAGIGSRETPESILSLMTLIGGLAQRGNYILRSGGAKGADQAFESLVDLDNKEIFYAKNATPESMELARQYHPNWGACNWYVKQLHGRNMMILLGENLDTPVDFIVCWTKDGKATGGTGQALRYAEANDIKIYNLFNNNNLMEVYARLNVEINSQDLMFKEILDKEVDIFTKLSNDILRELELCDTIIKALKDSKDGRS